VGQGQLELGFARDRELDRNFHRGGRSFYFFDFDDNIAVLTTPTYIFHKRTGAELKLNTREFAEASSHIGRSGPYGDYEIRYDDRTGSFRSFRDLDLSTPFLDDIEHMLKRADEHWKGPSWNCFYHAVFNRRPVAVITARGHHPETLKAGVRRIVSHGHLPDEPNYLALFPVNHPLTRQELGVSAAATVAERKQAAIRASVERAFSTYGYNPHHRFGMSDDDPTNLQLIVEEMTRLKKDYPDVSFFVFDTHRGDLVRREIYRDHTEDQVLKGPDQLALF
jgi:hypothetical protein